MRCVCVGVYVFNWLSILEIQSLLDDMGVSAATVKQRQNKNQASKEESEYQLKYAPAQEKSDD